MTTIKTIIADGDGVKGRKFTLDLTRPTLVVGPNGAGKSARLLACHLALGTRIGGSATPAQLGDVADDCGRVELMAEGQTGDGRRFNLTRILGHKHEARFAVGDEPLVKDIKGVEAALAAHLGVQRMAPTDLAEFVALTTEKQAAMVARTAGVTLADPTIRAELDEDLRGIIVEYDDARGQPRRGQPDDEQLAVLATLLSDPAAGLDGAKKHAADQKNEWQRKKQQAAKTRSQLVDLRREDLPPGNLADARRREAKLREELTEIRETLAARATARAERQRAAQRVEAARGRVAAAEKAVGAAPAGDADRARAARDAADDRHEATMAAHEKARAALRDADAALSAAVQLRDGLQADLALLDATIATLAAGSCPTCGTTGGALEDALHRLRAERPALAKRRLVAGLRADQTTAARADADRVLAEAGTQAREAAEALRKARAALDVAQAVASGAAGAAASLAASRDELTAAEAALQALPPLAGVDDLEGARDQRDAELTKVAATVEALAGYEEAERLRAANEQELDEAALARATWGALERTLGAFGVELARRAADRVCEHADRIVGAVYEGDQRFAFRPAQSGEDDAPAWGFGLQFTDTERADDWTPYAALSDSERIVCGVALTYAMLQLAARPFRPVVLDGLEALETERAFRLIRVLADELHAGRLDAVLCALRTDGTREEFDARSRAFLGAGVAVVDAAKDSVRSPSVTWFAREEGAPEPEAQADAAEPERLRGNCNVTCTGADGRGNKTMTAAAHRRSGCGCDAEARALAERAEKAAAEGQAA